MDLDTQTTQLNSNDSKAEEKPAIKPFKQESKWPPKYSRDNHKLKYNTYIGRNHH